MYWDEVILSQQKIERIVKVHAFATELSLQWQLTLAQLNCISRSCRRHLPVQNLRGRLIAQHCRISLCRYDDMKYGGNQDAHMDEDEYARKIWEEMNRRKHGGQRPSEATAETWAKADAVDSHAQRVRQAAEDAKQRSRKILDEEQAKDKAWRQAVAQVCRSLDLEPWTFVVTILSSTWLTHCIIIKKLIWQRPQKLVSLLADNCDYHWQTSARLFCGTLNDRVAFRKKDEAALIVSSQSLRTISGILANVLKQAVLTVLIIAVMMQGDLGVQRASYEAKWHAFSVSTAPVRLQDIPWLADDGQDNVKAVVLYGTDNSKEVRQRLKLELMRWHPDKFQGRFGHRIDSNQRQDILDKVKSISQILNSLLRQ